MRLRDRKYLLAWGCTDSSRARKKTKPNIKNQDESNLKGCLSVKLIVMSALQVCFFKPSLPEASFINKLNSLIQLLLLLAC